MLNLSGWARGSQISEVHPERVSTQRRGMYGFVRASVHRCFRREVDENRRGTVGSDGSGDCTIEPEVERHAKLKRKILK
jgi:hypothetical protein